jgi:hypothetical protein
LARMAGGSAVHPAAVQRVWPAAAAPSTQRQGARNCGNRSRRALRSIGDMEGAGPFAGEAVGGGLAALRRRPNRGGAAAGRRCTGRGAGAQASPPLYERDASMIALSVALPAGVSAPGGEEEGNREEGLRPPPEGPPSAASTPTEAGARVKRSRWGVQPRRVWQSRGGEGRKGRPPC